MSPRCRLLRGLSFCAFCLGGLLALPGLFLLIGAAQLSSMAIDREIDHEQGAL